MQPGPPPLSATRKPATAIRARRHGRKPLAAAPGLKRRSVAPVGPHGRVRPSMRAGRPRQGRRLRRADPRRFAPQRRSLAMQAPTCRLHPALGRARRPTRHRRSTPLPGPRPPRSWRPSPRRPRQAGRDNAPGRRTIPHQNRPASNSIAGHGCPRRAGDELAGHATGVGRCSRSRTRYRAIRTRAWAALWR